MGGLDYATASGVATNILVGVGNLSLKVPYTAENWTEQGYSLDGVSLQYTSNFKFEDMPWSTFPTGAALSREEVTLSVQLAQGELSVLRTVLPGVRDVTGETDKIYLGRRYDYGFTPVGFYLRGHGPSGKRRDVTVAFGAPIGSVKMDYTIRGVRAHLLLIRAMDSGSEYPVTIEDIAS